LVADDLERSRNVIGLDSLEITHFNIPPGTEGAPAVEIAYRRTRG